MHHGSRWADGYSDRQLLAYESENRYGFAALEILYESSQQISVVTVDQGRESARAERIYRQLGARFVTESGFDPWVERTAHDFAL